MLTPAAVIENDAIARPNAYGQKIVRAAVSVTAASLLVKVIATVKEIVLAGVYGRSDAMDAFLAALLIPNLLVNVISESMNQALLPTLVRVRLREGEERAQELLSNAMARLVALLAVICGVMAFTARLFFPIITWGFPAAKVDLCVRIFWMLLPTVLITGMATNGAAVLNTLERFVLPALAPAVVSILVITGALLLHRQLGIWAVVGATVLGTAAQQVAIARSMARQGYPLRWHWGATGEAEREVQRQYGPVLLSAVVASAGLLVDQALAAALPAGSVSSMAYAGRFVGVVLTLIAGAASSALAPYFSMMAAQSDWKACRVTLRRGMLASAAATLPISLAMIAGAPALVRITLQHGVFGARDTAEVGRVLAMYALQIPFFAASRVDYRFVLAMRRTDLVLRCGVLNLVLDVALDLVLMRYFGVAGLALATSLWAVSTWVFFRVCAQRLLAQAEAS
ncbi:hypothetical protein DYQ86_01640 [Acidobacteria bacterium AB60]|nr:hypothetical protein DYQ86_01640 [Acidobacteria bacterium AB60]